MHRLLVFAVAGLAALVVSSTAMAWSWPADGDVLRPFALGGDAYAAGQHRGVDVSGPEGSSVRAPAAGTVTFAGSLPTYGRGVTILTADGYVVTLVHLGSIGVAKGDAVVEGASIGTMGWSGDAEHAVPSVHLGIRVGAQAEGYVDPVGLLPPRAAPPAPPPPATSPAPSAASAASPAPVSSVSPPAPPTAASAQTTAAPLTAPPAGAAPASAAATPVASAPVALGETPAASDPGETAGSTTQALVVTAATPSRDGTRTQFRVDPRRGTSSAATRTAAPRAAADPRVAETPTRAAEQPADAGVAAAAPRARPAASEGAEARAAPEPLVRATAAADEVRPSARVTPGRAERPTAASVGPTAGRPAFSVPHESRMQEPTAVAATPPVRGGTRPGVLAAAALLVLLAAAAAAKAARRIGGNGAVLRHHADLLRQLHAAHRPRLHDRGGGRVRTPSTAARP